MMEGAREGFGVWFKAQREALGVSRTALADSLGIWPEALARIETLRRLPSEKFQQLLANALRAIALAQAEKSHDKR